jgi:PAS domain S-box-containing protein
MDPSNDRPIEEPFAHQPDSRLSDTNAVELAEIGCWEWNLDRDRVQWNPQVAHLLGLSAEISGLSYSEWRDRLHPNDQQQVNGAVNQALTQRSSYSVEYCVQHPDNQLVWLREKGCWCYEAQTVRLVGILQDISDRVRAEAQLQQQQDFLRAVIDTDPNLIFVKDIEGRYVLANKALADYYDTTVENLIGKTIEDMLEDKHLVKEFMAQNAAVIQNRQPMFIAEEAITRNGKQEWYQWQKQPLSLADYPQGGMGSHRNTYAALGIGVNITEAKQREAALKQAQTQLQQLNQKLEQRVQERTQALERSQFTLRQSEEQLRSIFENAPMGIMILDLQNQYKVVRCNVAQRELLNYDEAEIYQLTLADLTHPDDLEPDLEQMEALLSGKQLSFQMEKRFIRRHGEVIWCNVTITLLHDSQGHPVYSLGMTENITEKKAVQQQRQQAEEQLRRANEYLAMTNLELAQATRLKDEFLANMSHELRTPLNAIMGLSEVLQTGIFGEINDKQRQFLVTIQNSGSHLLELINDILDLAKIEAGKLELQISSVAIEVLCEESLAFVRHQAHEKNIALNVEIANPSALIQVDERRIRQVLINLLSNAVKFTPEGGSVTLKVEGSPETQWFQCSVMDTGIGIAPADLEKLFQAFVQIDSSLSRRYEGTGLGLVLVKQIVELHGGRVLVESQPGQGSCFTILLPWELSQLPLPAEMQAPSPPVYATVTRLKSSVQPVILVAEDNPDNVVTLISYLQAKGFHILLARDGIEAIELAKAYLPHLILMDIQMPRCSGLQAIDVLRQDPATAQIPIFALTALAMPGDRERCLAAGADEYLMKPVQLNNLANLIQTRLNTDESAMTNNQ